MEDNGFKNQKAEVNYIYLLTFFLILFALPLIDLSFVKTLSFLNKVLLTLHIFFQATLCTLFTLILSSKIKLYSNRLTTLFFSCLSFFLFAQIFDFLLFRVLGLSFYSVLFAILQDPLDSFVELLKASTLPWFFFLALFIFIGSIPLLGFLLYKISKKLSSFYVLCIKEKKLYVIFFSLLFLEIFLSLLSTNEEFDHFTNLLPLKLSIALNDKASFPKKLKSKITPSLKDLPKLENDSNLFLFIIESLREDFIEKEIAPTLFEFKKDPLTTRSSFSNSNATHLSWYSILSGNLPFHWKNSTKKGCFPLCLLKKLGYQIHVLSASELEYFNMKKILFGQKDFKNFYFPNPKDFPDPSDRDRLVLEKLSNLVEEKKTKKCFVVFLESTHFPYFFKESVFHPICEKHSVFSCFFSHKSLNKTINRYKNAIHFIDDQLKNFFQKLKDKNLYENSTIMITADHGEEFLEEGQLFHASRISFEQIRVPIYFKFSNKAEIKTPLKKNIFSHIDIMPTLLDTLFTSQPPFLRSFDGVSLFDPFEYPYVLSGRFNVGKEPFEFSLTNGQEKMVFSFAKPFKIFQSKKLKVFTQTNNPSSKMLEKGLARYFD